MNFGKNVVSSSKKGFLYLVATPIGNLEDITFRAIQILQSVDLILCEDTRQTIKLLNRYNIHKPLESFHIHNELETASKWVNRIEEGMSIALVSDAGTPLVSDPGYPLLQAALSKQIQVIPIPGACAAITALQASGLETQSFYFAGFLSHKHTQRLSELSSLKKQQGTLIFYESPHRVKDMLHDLLETFGGGRRGVIGRELTKIYEEFSRGTLQELVDRFSEIEIKGEWVVLVEGAKRDQQIEEDSDRLLSILLKKCSVRDAVSVMDEWIPHQKNQWYEKALVLKKKGSAE